MDCHKKATTVFVVLHYNYGDGGSKFKGAFATRQAAEDYVIKTEPKESEQQWYDIEETPVQEGVGRRI